MRNIVIALLVIALPASAPAADWVFVANCGEPGQLSAYSYDPGSIRRTGQALSVKVRGDYSQHASSRAREALMLWSFDCSKRTFVEASRREYDPGRKIVANHRKPTLAMAVMPESVPDKVFTVVCS